MEPTVTTPKPKPLVITQVSYGLTVNIGNYEAVRFDLTARVDSDTDWRDVFETLRRRSEKIRAQIQDEHQPR